MEAPGAGERVLIVDDVPDVARTLAHLLEDEGYRVETGSGRRAVEGALERARDEPPDLVLLDVMMGGLDGVEICRRLKADPSTAGIKVVFMTALPEWQLADRIGDCPYDDLIRKPYNLDDVTAAVGRLLRGRAPG